MRKITIILLIVFCLQLLPACNPSDQVVKNAIAATFYAGTLTQTMLEPSSTFTPIPTPTITITPSLIPTQEISLEDYRSKILAHLIDLSDKLILISNSLASLTKGEMLAKDTIDFISLLVSLPPITRKFADEPYPQEYQKAHEYFQIWHQDTIDIVDKTKEYLVNCIVPSLYSCKILRMNINDVNYLWDNWLFNF